MFLLLARFNAQLISYKAFILAFTTLHFRLKGGNKRQREVSTSMAQKRLRLSSLIFPSSALALG